MQISWLLLCCTILQAAFYVDILVITLLHNIVCSVLCKQISWSLFCCTILQAVYYVDILVVSLLHNIVGSVLCRYLGHYFAALYCRQHIMYISWSLLCCTIMQSAYYVDILVVTLLHSIVCSVHCKIYWSLLFCTILKAAFYVDILVITLLYNIVDRVPCRYLSHYFVAQYCRQRTMQIPLSLLCCTILQAAYDVDMLVVTLLHNIVDSVLCKYLGHYFAAQYCSLCKMQISWSLLCCTILLAVYYVDILFITLLHNIAVQYCRRRTIYISWSLLCCTILYAAYYVDILVITLLHNTVGSGLLIPWSLLCCTILKAAYNVDMLVVSLLHNIVDSVLCRYLGHYIAVQYCRQRTMQICLSLLCCKILQAVYYVDILIITLLHYIVGSVLCRYVGRYFAALYSRQHTMQIYWSLLCCTILQTAYYVDILVITLLHYIVGSVLCRYVGRYFAALYCRQHIMQIYWSLLLCTILQTSYYVDILVITFLHNIVGSVLCRYLLLLLCCTILQAEYYVDILVITLLHNNVGSVLCRYLDHYFAALYCRQRTMQICWSLLYCTILQTAYYVDILVITLLHNIVGSVLCRYLGHYFVAQYCRQFTMQKSWSLLCCTIQQAAYYLDILVITLLHNTVGCILCTYLGRYFVKQQCRQRSMQIS